MLLLSQDECVDVLQYLTRFNILMVALTSRKLRAAVDTMPPNSCLLRLCDVNLTRKRAYHWRDPTGFAERVRRVFQRFVMDTMRPYKLRISPSSDDLKSVRQRSLFSAKLIPAFLNAIQNSSVSSVCIDLPEIPRELEQMIRQSAATTGSIQEIHVNTDWQRVPPSSFEALPLLAAQVDSLELLAFSVNRLWQLTPAHQSEKLLRNCVDRGVYSLKLMNKEKHCQVADTSVEGLSDISEDTILEYCFAPRNTRADRPTQVELWLNWINLSPEFLSRFIQASESCDSDHKVKLLLRGANVCQQDLSQFRIHDPSGKECFGACTWTNEGKYTVRVLRNLQLGFFFAHRSSLPFDEWLDDNEGFVTSDLDAWIFVRPWG